MDPIDMKRQLLTAALSGAANATIIMILLGLFLFFPLGGIVLLLALMSISVAASIQRRRRYNSLITEERRRIRDERVEHDRELAVLLRSTELNAKQLTASIRRVAETTNA